MSWPDRPARRPAALALLLLLPTACGFQPLYGKSSALGGGASGGVAGTLAAVEVETIPDRSGQLLRSYLVDRFAAAGPDVAPLYSLAVDLSEQREQLGIRGDDTATRVNLILTGSFVLTELATGAPVLRDRAGVITSYSILLDEFATLNNQRDARERALRQLSDDIQRQVALFIARISAS